MRNVDDDSDDDCFYARTADVTALVLAGGAGTYAVGRGCFLASALDAGSSFGCTL